MGLDGKVIYDQADLVNALDLLGVNDTVELHIVRTTDQVHLGSCGDCGCTAAFPFATHLLRGPDERCAHAPMCSRVFRHVG